MPRRFLALMIFARCKMTFDMWNYYSEHTDVWVFGTADHYRTFALHLDRHATGSASHTQLPVDDNSPGMDVLLLSTCKDARPFLLLQERLVYQRTRLNMELMIAGTSEGFAFLRDQFSQIIRTADGDPSCHTHIDNDNELLSSPCVFLNIRGPARTWSEEHLDPYWSYCVMPGSPNRLPSGIDHHTAETSSYDLPGYDDLYGKLPRTGNA
jgi:hypothetical protein